MSIFVGSSILKCAAVFHIIIIQPRMLVTIIDIQNMKHVHSRTSDTIQIITIEVENMYIFKERRGSERDCHHEGCWYAILSNFLQLFLKMLWVDNLRRRSACNKMKEIRVPVHYTPLMQEAERADYLCSVEA